MSTEKIEIRTTGHLRTILANAVKGVMNGELDVDRATALHKLAKNISDSLYSETKIAILNRETDPSKMIAMGDLPLGGSK